MEKQLKSQLNVGNNMLTLLVEVILGVFVSNFKASEHPYISNFIKGILIGIIGFIFGNIIGYYENNTFLSLNDQILYFFVSQGIGFIFFIFYSFFDFFIKHK